MIAPDEWETICMLIEEGWPGEFSDTAATAWRVFLDDYEPEQVLAALKALVARGGTFRPSVAEVVAQIRNDPSKPTFPEALVLIRTALRAYNRPLTGNFANEAEMLKARYGMVERRAVDTHPLVAAFIARYKVPELQDLLAGLEDETYGAKRRRDLEREWDRHCEACEGREIAALASGRRGELGSFDPLAALGLGRRREIAPGSEAAVERWEAQNNDTKEVA